jgi:glycosyltransferase involved in cell wall biosynthesis
MTTSLVPHPHRATIPPLPEGAERPLWSVMIPTYNNGDYLRQTLVSVLSQDPGPEFMQIEVVDDCSSGDDPGAIVRTVGNGRVAFYRQAENVGHTRNFETCLNRARGHLVHLLHGDDAVRPGFYQRLQEAFAEQPAIGAAFCRYVAIDEDGNEVSAVKLEMPTRGVLPDWISKIGAGQRLQTPCMVVRRTVYEALGGFDDRLRGAEDWEMWVRIAAHYAVWYEPEPLAVYRLHMRSKSQRALRTGANLRALRKAIEINREHLPPDKVDHLTRRAVYLCARAALRRANRLRKAGDREGAKAQMRGAWETSPSMSVAARAAAIFLLWRIREMISWFELVTRQHARRRGG